MTSPWAEWKQPKDWRALGWVAAAPLAVAAILAGCTLQQRTPAPSQTAAPTLGEGRGFFLNQDGDNASLAYGAANSDDVQLMLQCRRGSRAVEVINVAREGQAKGVAVLTLASGSATSDLKAQVAPDDAGETLASAHATTALPALAAFRQSGVITVKLGAQAYALRATLGERISVARFFGACERR